MSQSIIFRKHGNMLIADFNVAMLEDSLETGGCQQAVRSGIGGAGARQGNRSDRKTRATFCPASLDDKTTVLGTHAGTKTVGALTLQVAGLECSLHSANRFQKRLKARTASQIRPRRLLVLLCRCQLPDYDFSWVPVVDKSPMWG